MATVYRSDNGKQVEVPDHWVGHPRLGKPFRKTPPPAKGAVSKTHTEKAPAAGDDQKKEH